MNKEEPLRDQAERLRKRIVKKEEAPNDLTAASTLPPRSNVHQQKKKRTKWKLKYPVIRLLALFFILLPIVSFSLYTINENNKNNGPEPVIGESKGNVEAVDIENKKPEEKVESKDTIQANQEQAAAEQIEPAEVESNLAVNSSNDKAATEKGNTADKSDTTETKKKTVYHKVQDEDTLFSIAMKYYNSQSGIEKIKRENGISGNEIQVGQTLRITIPN